MSVDHERELRLRVAARTEPAEGVVAFELQDADGYVLPEWTPGAHIDLVLANGLVRQYSLVGRGGATWKIAVLREPAGRGGSEYVATGISVGDVLDARGPRNHFELEPAGEYLFIAGGIGITPITAMVAEAERAGVLWRLIYGGRSRASMAFADDLVAAHGERVTLVPQDVAGLIDLPAVIGTPRRGVKVYCCGPAPLLDAVERVCEPWPPGTLHVERFVPKAVAEPLRHDSFDVELAASGITVTVEPGRSILTTVEEAGVLVLSSCGEGTCGTCETRVLTGAPEHRDSVLSPEEQERNDTMMICVSRSLGPKLVLDL
jgi:ferredoxin-NADP reductase